MLNSLKTGTTAYATFRVARAVNLANRYAKGEISEADYLKALGWVTPEKPMDC